MGLVGPDRRSEGIPRYNNAPMMVVTPEGTVVATGGRFVKNLGVMLITMAAGFW